MGVSGLRSSCERTAKNSFLRWSASVSWALATRRASSARDSLSFSSRTAASSFWFSTLLSRNASSAFLRSVMSMIELMMTCSPPSALTSDETNPIHSPPPFLKKVNSALRIMPCCWSSRTKRSRSLGSLQMLSRGLLSPTTSSRAQPVISRYRWLTSMKRPSCSRVIAIAAVLPWNALANFSSESRSASSAPLRLVMSRI